MLVDNPQPITHKELLTLAQFAKGSIKHIYLHWTAGHYHQAYDDYHFNIDADGTVYRTCLDLRELKSHTWRRNSRSIGIALCCAVDASIVDRTKINFGPEPPTIQQIERMAEVVAYLCEGLGLKIDYTTVMTHFEAAFKDGYGPGSDDPEMRWDLWLIPDHPITNGLRFGGPVLRGKALWYQHKHQELAMKKGNVA